VNTPATHRNLITALIVAGVALLVGTGAVIALGNLGASTTVNGAYGAMKGAASLAHIPTSH